MLLEAIRKCAFILKYQEEELVSIVQEFEDKDEPQWFRDQVTPPIPKRLTLAYARQREIEINEDKARVYSFIERCYDDEPQSNS
jgi:hypothetical protein